MSAGDKEIMLASEETNRRNIETCISHANETRKIVRELEEKVLALQTAGMARDQELTQLKIQLATIQTRVFSGGTE